MNLTEWERTILQLAKQGLSDYKIARKMSMDPPNVTRSRKNAYKKLDCAATDLKWAIRTGIEISQGWIKENCGLPFKYFCKKLHF